MTSSIIGDGTRLGKLSGVVEEVTIPWADGEVSGRLAAGGDTGILLAHGAGTNQDHETMVMLRDGLAAAGHAVVTFNYPYTERGAKRPDRAEKLISCHRGAADYLSAEVDRLFFAGRSMGGRIGTYLVAEGYPAAGIILYAYPLHPAGKPEKLRIDQFADISVPMLFLQGTRDALSKMELFDEHIAALPNATVDLLEGASHGFRGGGWKAETIVERYVEVTVDWIAGLSSGESGR